VSSSNHNHDPCVTAESFIVDCPGNPLKGVEDEWRSTDEEEDSSVDASTDESSIVAPHGSPVFSTDSELDISFLSVEADSQDSNIISVKNMPTFKLVGDNLDLYIRPRSETADHHAESKHFFHAFAVRDRIDVSSFDNTFPSLDISSINLEDVLPQQDDVKKLKENLMILVSRKIRKFMPFFRKHIDSGAISQHIEHKYSDEMSKKSEVVSRLHSSCTNTLSLR